MVIKAGLDICDLVDAAQNYCSANNFDYKESYMNYLVSNIDQYIDDNRKYENNRKSVKYRRYLSIIPCFGHQIGNLVRN